MGTRGLTAVMHDGKYKLAQYGQRDHYPGGQGVTALEFCRDHLATAEGRERFAKQLDRVKFCTQEDVDQMLRDLGIDPAKEWHTVEEMEPFHEKWPHFTRDHGAEILELVWGADGEVRTNNQIDFAGDSLFCEYAYVVDLDALTFEVFKGFNKDPLADGERFAKAPDNGKEYRPVRLMRKWRLDDLPSREGFIEALRENDVVR